MESLSELHDHIGDCHRCQLGETRTRLVFGVGREDADIMLIGEAPGKNEDLKGEPFVGAAGQLLDELLASIGMHRSDVYIANILKCRPPGNRNPLPDEIQTCTPFLREQVRLVDPLVIVTLGNFATKFVLKTEHGITRLRGSVQHAGRFTVVPVFHPAAALYDVTKRDILFGDFALIAEALEALESRRADPGEPQPEPGPRSELESQPELQPEPELQPQSKPEPVQGELFGT